MSDSSKSPELLWKPRNAEQTPMSVYRRHVNRTYNLNLKTTHDLHKWSVESPQEFWIDLYRYLQLKPSLPSGLKKAYDGTALISSIPPFFPGVKLNYAENALFANPDPDAIALVGVREGVDLSKEDGEELTWHQAREKVRLAASALRRIGVKQGDRVAALVANSIWAMLLFHASAAFGAIFTSISPELGLEGCVSRLQQVTPSILFADSDTVYKGKTVSAATKVRQILGRLSPKPQTFIVPVTPQRNPTYPSIEQFMAQADPSDPLTFAPTTFNDPLMICYSSGTTGAPKCIVHRHGLLMQLKKISAIHNSTTTKDVILQYLSTSWVVFYIMCGYFACGAKTIVYNGSPMYPDARQLLRMVEKYEVTYFGSSPRYLLEVEMSKCIPKQEFDLKSLRIVYTTGATLSPEQYRWFYSAFPPDVHLCNTAGGTDTATSLIAADPCGPIYAGEMQVFGLGMDVDIADPTSGHSIMYTREAGEMIVRKPYPSMPCFFWGDEGNKKYKESYFERFENVDVWAQHDWLSRNPKTGGLVMHGRSDGVLNPSGIRFGSGEIYAIVEAAPLNTYISNSLCVGRRRPQDTDEDVFLFVVMAKGHTFTPELSTQIKQAIRQALSPRHVPKFVIEIPEVPVTINGKKVETAVKQVLGGRDVVPSNTVVNPEMIGWFERFRWLEREGRESKL
ncbi:acetyl-CoA synthetase-like protein [Teratosphaeria nubilosa]|uniref:Acetyl-CoA synthetase-like protein n=1 Tax=Teratosphaeria nubilosa TaxID=161662 RepID=A0A6G1KW11_9PEZI|nr:acetyl-CoA synthetase-like protein [Teratosphaeria nubilosa]